MVVAVAALASGCGTTATPPRHDTAAAPRRVAVAYLDAVRAGDLATAATHVVAPDRPIVQAMGLSAGTRLSASVTGHVRPGSVTVRGHRAAVVFVGRMCRPTERPGVRDCVENADPHTRNPVFVVRLAERRGRWQVTLGPGRD